MAVDGAATASAQRARALVAVSADAPRWPSSDTAWFVAFVRQWGTAGLGRISTGATSAGELGGS